MFDLQADLQAGVARQGKDSDEGDAETEPLASDGDDVSDRWDDKKRQDAVENLLGSCAGSDFMGTADPPQVHTYSSMAKCITCLVLEPAMLFGHHVAHAQAAQTLLSHQGIVGACVNWAPAQPMHTLLSACWLECLTR